ncbi:MAG: hypothetical protein IT438_13165 [Phycisphaerales bacterium]|nr:hypothetical protein [Phycisphaerales bacterium]
MFAKIVAVILTIGTVACVLLAIRQQRVQAAHELAQVQRRVLDQDRTLWQLRSEIAARIIPSSIAANTRRFGPLAGNAPGRYRDLVRRENRAESYTAAQP